MIGTKQKPLYSKVLVVEEGLAQLDTASGRSAQADVGNTIVAYLRSYEQLEAYRVAAAERWVASAS